MSIERELKEAIEKEILEIFWNNLHTVTFAHTNQPNEPHQQVLFKRELPEITTALLPLFAKYAVSLVEVDEGKVENILRDKLAEYDGNMETIPKDWEEKTARTLATSNIIKPKE